MPLNDRISSQKEILLEFFYKELSLKYEFNKLVLNIKSPL